MTAALAEWGRLAPSASDQKDGHHTGLMLIGCHGYSTTLAVLVLVLGLGLGLGVGSKGIIHVLRVLFFSLADFREGQGLVFRS